jgi:hypothetical protein
MMRVTYTRIGNPYRYWIVGCDECQRRLHIDSYGRMRDHNKSKGEQCPGSGRVSSEFSKRTEGRR